jgi:hypothetical protein
MNDPRAVVANFLYEPILDDFGQRRQVRPPDP